MMFQNLKHWFYTEKSKVTKIKMKNIYKNKLVQFLLFVPSAGPRRFITAVADESSMGLHTLL